MTIKAENENIKIMQKVNTCKVVDLVISKGRQIQTINNTNESKSDDWLNFRLNKEES